MFFSPRELSWCFCQAQQNAESKLSGNRKSKGHSHQHPSAGGYLSQLISAFRHASLLTKQSDYIGMVTTMTAGKTLTHTHTHTHTHTYTASGSTTAGCKTTSLKALSQRRTRAQRSLRAHEGQDETSESKKEGRKVSVGFLFSLFSSCFSLSFLINNHNVCLETLFEELSQ